MSQFRISDIAGCSACPEIGNCLDLQQAHESGVDGENRGNGKVLSAYPRPLGILNASLHCTTEADIAVAGTGVA